MPLLLALGCIGQWPLLFEYTRLRIGDRTSRREHQLTDNGFDIFFGSYSARLGLERAARAESEGQGLIVLCEEIINLGGDESGYVARRFGEIIALVQCFTKTQSTTALK